MQDYLYLARKASLLVQHLQDNYVQDLMQDLAGKILTRLHISYKTAFTRHIGLHGYFKTGNKHENHYDIVSLNCATVCTWVL